MSTHAARLAWWPARARGLGALGLAVGLAIVDALPVGVVADDAMYVILARSLASGEGYRYLNAARHAGGDALPAGLSARSSRCCGALAPAFPGTSSLFKAANAVCLAVRRSVCMALLLRSRSVAARSGRSALGRARPR